MEWIIGIVIIAAVVGLYVLARRNRKSYPKSGRAPRRDRHDRPGEKY